MSILRKLAIIEQLGGAGSGGAREGAGRPPGSGSKETPHPDLHAVIQQHGFAYNGYITKPGESTVSHIYESPDKNRWGGSRETVVTKGDGSWRHMTHPDRRLDKEVTTRGSGYSALDKHLKK